MINLLIGPPGGGKSYEAVVYHVLPALQRGRKVITNLPLVLERFAALDPSWPDLIEVRKRTKAERPEVDWKKAESMYQRFGIATRTPFFSERAFANPEDFGDPWRHPETGSGPLYVIDECHLALPRGGTVRGVEEWFSLHRHESADVLLITQSYGKVSLSIIELVQVSYRVKKATAFGSASRYIRKVQDGVRGDVVNTAVRNYEKRYFGLYLSHTRGGGAELAAQDIVPIWKRWPFVAAGVVLPAGLIWFLSQGSIFEVAKPKAVQAAEERAKRAPQPSKPVHAVPDPSASPAPATPAREAVPLEPYGTKGLHYVGKLSRGDRVVHLFGVSHAGVMLNTVTDAELERAGYRIRMVGDCTGWLYYGKSERPVVCDSPGVTVGAVSSVRAGVAEGPPAGGGAAAPVPVGSPAPTFTNSGTATTGAARRPSNGTLPPPG